MNKTFILCALLSVLSLVGCCQEHKQDKHEQEQQEKDNRESGLDWYTNPANPIGLFRDSWNVNN